MAEADYIILSGWGLSIPYWKYMGDESILDRIVIKSLHRSPFKYGSREVSKNDISCQLSDNSVIADRIVYGINVNDWIKLNIEVNKVYEVISDEKSGNM